MNKVKNAEEILVRHTCKIKYFHTMRRVASKFSTLTVIVQDWNCVTACTIQKHSCCRDKQCNCSCQGTSVEPEKPLVVTRNMLSFGLL